MSTNYTLVIGNKNYSSWSMRPWVWMRHHNIAFNEQRIALFEPGMRAAIDQFDAGSTVPILVTGDTAIWDSLAILEYLAEQHIDKSGWPDLSDTKGAMGGAARAIARSVSAEMHSGFSALRGELPMNCRRQVENFSPSDAVLKDVARVQKIFTDCRTRFGQKGPWLFGAYSIADAMYTPVVMRFNTYGIGLTETAAEYARQVTRQPAVQEWIQSSKNESEIIENSEV